MRVTNAGNGNDATRALTTVLRTRKCGINLCASPRLISFSRQVHIGNITVPPRHIIAFIRARQRFFTPLRPSFFRLAATLTFLCFSRRRISVTIVRINLNKQLSYAGVVAPVLSIVAGVDLSRARLLNSDLTGVTCRGTKVVGSNIPYIVKRVYSRDRAIFQRITGREGDPLVVTRRRSRVTRIFTLANSCRREGGSAVLSTISILQREVAVDSRTVHCNLQRIITLAKLHKH